MNRTNGARIMYYDAEQRKFIVEEISLDTDEANDTTASADSADPNTAVRRFV